MENKGKGPEELLAEYNTIVNRIVSDTETGLAVFKTDQHDWLRSSMSDLLRWSAEQLPPYRQEVDDSDDKYTCDQCGSQSYIQGCNQRLADCQATLLRLADEICAPSK